MKYNTFKCMVGAIRREIDFYIERKKSEGEIVERVLDRVIYDWFWNYVTDMPICDYDQMKVLIQNTVRHQLHA